MLCNRVFKLNDLRAFQIMKSTEQVYGISAGKTLGELKEEIVHLKLRRATSRLENPMKLREAKRDLARVETVLRERALRQREG